MAWTKFTFSAWKYPKGCFFTRAGPGGALLRHFPWKRWIRFSPKLRRFYQVKTKRGGLTSTIISAAIICPLSVVSNHIPPTSFYSLTSDMPEINFFLMEMPPKAAFSSGAEPGEAILKHFPLGKMVFTKFWMFLRKKNRIKKTVLNFILTGIALKLLKSLNSTLRPVKAIFGAQETDFALKKSPLS